MSEPGSVVPLRDNTDTEEINPPPQGNETGGTPIVMPTDEMYQDTLLVQAQTGRV